MVLTATRFHAEGQLNARFFANASKEQIEEYFDALEDKEAGHKPGSKGWEDLAKASGDYKRADRMRQHARLRKTIETINNEA